MKFVRPVRPCARACRGARVVCTRGVREKKMPRAGNLKKPLLATTASFLDFFLEERTTSSRCAAAAPERGRRAKHTHAHGAHLDTLRPLLLPSESLSDIYLPINRLDFV
jgi:hypothetical protein